MLHTLDTQIRLPVPREEVFPFFCDAFNLERITPAELRFRILSPGPIEMGEGTRIRYRLSLWGIPFKWETVIRCWEPPYRFVDEQVSGPYRRWVHRHELVETPQGTMIYDHVDYELPLSPVGDVFHPVLRRQLARIFRFRHQVLHSLFESDDFPEAPLLIDADPNLVPAVVSTDGAVAMDVARTRPPGETWHVKLLYDGACPFCMAEVRWLEKRDRGGMLALEDIAAPGFDPGRYGLDQKTVEGKIHAILPDGSVVTGMEVFRRIYGAVGLGWLLAPTGWPVLRPLFDLGYKWFARHRVRLGNLFGRPDCSEARCQTRS